MGLKNRAGALLQRSGEAATVTDYTATGTSDDYGDPVFTETTRSTVALFRQPQRDADPSSSPGGQLTSIDAIIYVDDADADVVEPASGGHIRASSIVRDGTGEEFIVVDVWDENNGLLRVAAEKVND